MATIQLTDGFGLVLDATPSPSSAFSKYLKDPGAIKGFLHDAKDIRDLTIAQDPFQSLSAGVSFSNSIDLGSNGTELKISPQLEGTVAIKTGAALFDPSSDPFADPIPIPANDAYLSASLTATLNIGLSAGVSDLQFGFTAGTNISLANYHLFALTDKIVPSLQTLLQDFTIPGDVEDITAMPPRAVSTVEGTGTLKFSAQVNLLSAVNPLAAVNTSVTVGPLNIKDGAEVRVGATYTLTGDYQLRILRLGGTKFRLGFQKKRSSEFDVSVTADITTSATAGGFDIIQKVLQAVSPDTVADKATFQKAGLTDDQISTLAAALKAGLESTLSLSIKAELDALDSSSAAFSYEIDLAALDAAAKAALNQALDGDLSSLEQSSLNGIQPLKSIFSTLRDSKRTVNINLLGIFNCASVTELFQKGTIVVDRQSGDITIADQAGANRISFTSDNFAKDPAKLRKVLAESFLMAVTYRSSKTVPSGPSFSSTQWFFGLHQQTNLQNIKDYLNVAVASDLLSPLDASRKLNAVSGLTSFGPSTFNLNASYNDAVSKSLFLDSNGQVRAEADYQRVGRFALASLLPAGNPMNDARRLPLTNDQIWAAMLETGQPNNFGGLFSQNNFNANQLADIAADFTVIVWWAESMHNMAKALLNLLTFFAQHPQWDPQDNTFRQLRAKLDQTMASVASNTKDEFAEPWGFVAMDLTSGQMSTKTLELICPRMSLALASPAPHVMATKAQ